MFDVIKYVHENITEKLGLSEVAEHFGYSKEHFSRKFRQFTDMTFSEYVRHYRIQLASIDILAGEKISDVAMNYGYDTVGGFNKAFLKEFGCFPREYKKYAKESQLYYERRKISMYRLSQRCSLLRDEVVTQRSYMNRFCAQRAVYFVLGAQKAKNSGLDMMMTIASAVTHVIRNFTPVIIPGELITGFNFGDGNYGDLFIPKNEAEHIALMKQNAISQQDIEDYFKADASFKTVTFVAGLNLTPQEDVGLSQKENEAAMEWAGLGRSICSNHTVVGYEEVLKKGYEGILSEIRAYREKNGGNHLYDAAEMICTEALQIGEKYAAEAKRLLDNRNPNYAEEDLKTIIEICSNVPRHPARSFKEAVQSLWFAHIINTWEDSINANSLGRLDQILYPYYKNDIESGALTKEEAFEIVCLLWIKLYRDYDVQQSCVGGTLENGESAVNDLSYMMLDATEELDFIRCLSVRFSKATEKGFLRRALEVVGHVQKGVPFFFNDDVMIPALQGKGISHEDACDYTQIGCVETSIPGKANPHAVTGETNLLKAIEYVLCNGRSMTYPEINPGIKTGELEQFDSYAKFYDAVIAQVDHILDITCSQVTKYADTCNSPKPYKSILTKGCLETAKDFNEKGALYDYYQVMLGGIPNLADSLMVIKKFIYQNKKYTLTELKKILESNYADESIRLEFMNKASKFGNDMDEVDSIAVDITDHACDQLDILSEKYGISFHAQPFTYLWMIAHGRCSCASPDGRKAGEPIAYSVSPMQGRDFSGLTAVMNSISKFPTKKTPGTTSAIVEVDPKLFTDRNIDALTDILVVAGRKGLSNVQYNVVDAEMLMDAKKHPEKYNNLAVRVSGFSQKFNLLNEDLQDHIIGRTKHLCL